MERGYQKLATLIKEVDLEIQDRETTFYSMSIQEQKSERGESFLNETEELEYVKYAYERGIEYFNIRRKREGKPKFEPKILLDEEEMRLKRNDLKTTSYKLIPMTNYVIIQCAAYGTVPRLIAIKRYAEFLRLNLRLGMFVPCDEHGEPLEKPIPEAIMHNRGVMTVDSEEKEECRAYLEASGKVLFEGFTFVKKDTYRFSLRLNNSALFELRYNERIEDYVNFDLELTSNAVEILKSKPYV